MTWDEGRPMAVSINSSLVLLVDDYENRLEICKLELNPVPLARLETLCFLELPPSPSTSISFSGFITEWVPTSKSYARTRSSRGYHLPFYSSAIGTIALRFQYQLLPGVIPIEDADSVSESYALIISVAALISVIPTDSDARNVTVPWEDWGPSSTHLYKMAPMQLTSVGPFWIPDFQSLVVRQYDLRRTHYTQLMPGTRTTSLRQSWSPIDSRRIFHRDIETYLPYRDVMMETKDLYQSASIVADREWVVGVRQALVRGFFAHIFGIFRCEAER